MRAPIIYNKIKGRKGNLGYEFELRVAQPSLE